MKEVARKLLLREDAQSNRNLFNEISLLLVRKGVAIIDCVERGNVKIKENAVDDLDILKATRLLALTLNTTRDTRPSVVILANILSKASGLIREEEVIKFANSLTTSVSE